MIVRDYEPISQFIRPGKVLIVYGPRQVGKTTLLRKFLENSGQKHRLLDGQDVRIQAGLSTQNSQIILSYAESYDLIAIDEAQYVPNIGMALKILVDERPDLAVIATGSSSFELAGQVGEPLTGRKRQLLLLPIAQSELLGQMNRQELRERLEQYLVFGCYPEVLTAPTREARIQVLDELVGSYLLKDVLALDGIKASRTLLELLKLVALQLGSEVSINELATKTSASYRTVKQYLDLLEKAYVLYRLDPYSLSMRDEVVSSKPKYYFYDTGIRNALIQRFNELAQRDQVEIGGLWENWVFMERLKYRLYHNVYGNAYFWHPYRTEREVDLVEERDGVLHGIEFKWSTRDAPGAPKKWAEAGQQVTYRVINPDNYLDFVLPPRQ
jgi:uncharacterized protein